MNAFLVKHLNDIDDYLNATNSPLITPLQLSTSWSLTVYGEVCFFAPGNDLSCDSYRRVLKYKEKAAKK